MVEIGLFLLRFFDCFAPGLYTVFRGAFIKYFILNRLIGYARDRVFILL